MHPRLFPTPSSPFLLLLYKTQLALSASFFTLLLFALSNWELLLQPAEGFFDQLHFLNYFNFVIIIYFLYI